MSGTLSRFPSYAAAASGEALRRINEGPAAMIRTKGEAGTGDVVEAVRHIRALWSGVRNCAGMREDELLVAAEDLQAPYDLIKDVAKNGKLPRGLVNFVAGGIATPSDAALAVGSGLRASLLDRASSSQRIRRAPPMPSSRRRRHFDNPQIHGRVAQGTRPALPVSRCAPCPRASGSPFAAGRHTPDFRRGSGNDDDQRRLATSGSIGLLPFRAPSPSTSPSSSSSASRRSRSGCRVALEGLSGLNIPGGESTAMRKLIDRWELRQPNSRPGSQGCPDLQTCAGMILSAKLNKRR